LIEAVKIKNLMYKITWMFGPKAHQRIMYMYLYLKDFDGREHKKRWGGVKREETIYYIRPRTKGKGEGLLSIFVYVMSRIEYADRMGWIPFVDVDTGSTVSMFNRYFRVKNNLTREDVFNSKNVILSGWNSKEVHPGWADYMSTENNLSKYKVLSKYIELTDEVKNMFAMEKEIIAPEECLGLYLRGTDYTRLKPWGHPIQPSVDEIKEKIDEIMQDSGIKRIFLVTEDADIKKQVINEYGDAVCTINEDYCWSEYTGKMIMETIQKYGDVEKNNILYLVKILLLSQCKAFVGGITNGSVTALAYNADHYEWKYVYNKGLYT